MIPSKTCLSSLRVPWHVLEVHAARESGRFTDGTDAPDVSYDAAVWDCTEILRAILRERRGQMSAQVDSS